MKLQPILQAAVVATVLMSSSAFSESLPALIEHPTYRDGILYIPRIDTERQAGHYLDATLQFDSASGVWKLADFYNALAEERVPNAGLMNPEKIEVIVTDSLPIQVFLKTSVTFGDGCIRYGQINLRRAGNTFEIVMHRDHGIYPTVVCAAPVIDEKVIPLQVYGLPAGTYEYIVNGLQTGTFTLSKDNTL